MEFRDVMTRGVGKNTAAVLGKAPLSVKKPQVYQWR